MSISQKNSVSCSHSMLTEIYNKYNIFNPHQHKQATMNHSLIVKLLVGTLTLAKDSHFSSLFGTPIISKFTSIIAYFVHASAGVLLFGTCTVPVRYIVLTSYNFLPPKPPTIFCLRRLRRRQQEYSFNSLFNSFDIVI